MRQHAAQLIAASALGARTHTLLLVILLACGTLMGCAAQVPRSGDNDSHSAAPLASADTQIPAAEAVTEQPNRPFTEQELYNLLLAEFAVTNQQVPTALQKYSIEAQRSRDPGVAERATRIALYARDAETALRAATLWHELEPSNDKAARILVELLARAGRPHEATAIIATQLHNDQPASFAALRGAKFTDGSGDALAVSDALETLRSDYPNNAELSYTQAFMLNKAGQNEAALTLLTSVKRSDLSDLSDDDNTAVDIVLLEANILESLEDYQRAARHLRKASRQRPDNRRLHIYYARMLTHTDLDGAQAQFAHLLEETPDDAELLFSHALVAGENKDDPAAAASLETLLALGRRQNAAHYHLGEIAARNDDPAAALAHFSQVGAGQYQFGAMHRVAETLTALEPGDPGLARAADYLAAMRAQHPKQAPALYIVEATLLRDNNQAASAHALLSRALQQYPDDKYLRLERSLISEMLDRVELAISDLRQVLSRHPDDVMALNALGYTLADRTERYAEARELIDRAHAQKPDDGAIIDSLGWVQFKQGEYRLAIDNLQKAYDMYVDDEVAAHLVEALWADGQQRRARKIIRSMQRRGQATPELDATLLRLGID